MTVRRIEAGPRMTQAVVHGNTVYLAGQVGAGQSVAEQTRDILATVDRLLASRLRQVEAAAGDHLAGRHEGLRRDELGLGQVGRRGNTPARATGEAKLAGPEYKVEIIITAA